MMPIKNENLGTPTQELRKKKKVALFDEMVSRSAAQPIKKLTEIIKPESHGSIPLN
jgi:hypothetical protein